MVLSGGVLLIIILATLLATLSPYDPIAVETGQKFLPPSAQHLLGTDNFGRDTFTRLLYGGRVSLLVGFLSMLISIVFGTVYGIVSGSSGKLVDGFMMRIVDILMSVPSFLIIITLNIYMNAGIRTLVVTIGLFSWMGVARIVRAEVLSLRERDFILASEGLGFSLTTMNLSNFHAFPTVPLLGTLDVPPFERTLIASWKRGKPLSFPARKLIDLTRECMRNHPELDYTAFRFCRPEEVGELM